MAHDDQSPPTLSETELPAITPLEFVVTEDASGMPALDVRESQFEQAYGLDNPYSCWIFVALCRREGLMAYRRPRQRSTTICVRTTAAKHESLWRRYTELSRQLNVRLAKVTHEFVREQVEGRGP